jgi:aryl-alcohol dehydrogenase-like predicted oxidoreductase
MRTEAPLINLLAALSKRIAVTLCESSAVGLGGRSRQRLEVNIGAGDLSLTADDLAEIQTAAARIQVQGERYRRPCNR